MNNRQISSFPLKRLLILLAVWGVLFIIYRFILPSLSLDTPKFFPVSILIENGLHIEGAPYLIAFWIILVALIIFIDRIPLIVLVAGCWVLIVLGNLGQNNFEMAFLQPFYAGTQQYFHEISNVHRWREWLANFNQAQPFLTLHSKTHPPFAVLIHVLFMVISGSNIVGLSVGFSLIAALSVPLVGLILILFETPIRITKLLIILFALLPSINIYSMVSLDGIILTTTTVFLLGLVILIRKPSLTLLGFTLTFIGLLATNMLTYGGLFLFGVGFVVFILNFVSIRNNRLSVAIVVGLLAFCCIVFLLKVGFQYDHIQGFVTATKLENTSGFLLFVDPVHYFLTRFEDVAEIAFFLSFGVLALILDRRLFTMKLSDYRLENPRVISMIGIFILLMMFVAGSYRTGETARACLFIYPYIILLLNKVDAASLKTAILLAGLQTSVMQFSAGFFW